MLIKVIYGDEKMKLVAGDMLWTNINKIPDKYTYLSNDIECDALIIGGGVTGAIIAYYLTKEGIDTVLVDKNIIGYGSTRASTAILQYEVDTDLYGLSHMIGEEKAAKCFELSEKAVFDIRDIVNELDDDCDFMLKECFYYTSNSSHISLLKKEFDLRKKHGFNVEFIDKNNAKDKFSFPIEAGIYSKSGGALIDPYKFTRALIKKSIKNGLKVYENTEINIIQSESNHVYLKTPNDFSIKAKKVIMAAGYESKKYIDRGILNITRTFNLVTKPIKEFNGWHNKCIIRDDNDPYIYFRTTADNRIIVGGEDEKVGKETSKMSNLTNEDLVSIKKYDILLKKLKDFFPDIKDIEVEYKFSGLFGVTKDGLPYIGEYSKMPNCYFALAYGSNGIVNGILCGQLIKDLYLNNKRDELDLFKFDR